MSATKKKRFKIQARRYHKGQSHYGNEAMGKITGDFGKHDVVDTFTATVWGEQIGNFNPFFCHYMGKRCLVLSDGGDVSDPFRRKESYADTFFIELDKA